MGIEHIYEARRKHLREAAQALHPGRGQKKVLADRLGREPNYVSRLLSSPQSAGHKRIGEELAREFELKLGKAAYWLDGFGNEEPANAVRESPPVAYENPAPSLATVRIPYYTDVSASAGHGCVPLDEANVTMLDVAKRLLERCGIAEADAALLQADGDSMKGVIEHGDLMVVDLSQQEIREGKIFVISIDNELLVKRVQRIPRGIKLVSENPIYDSITVMDGDQDTNVRLVGRVALSWSMTGFM